MSIQPKTLKEFHAMLDRVIELQTQLKDTKKELEVLDYSSREIFVQAVELIRKEGFGDYEISELVREYLRMRIPKGSLNRYLSELKPVEPEEEEEEVEDSTSQSDSESNTTEESSTEQEDEKPTEIAVTAGGEEVIETPNQTEEPDEDPKDLEIQFLKERVGELEDALKKTEQFRPATQIERSDDFDEYGTNETKVFEWLGKREDKVSRYWFPNYGIELFRTRILSDLNNRGVKMFKRLYFEV